MKEHTKLKLKKATLKGIIVLDVMIIAAVVLLISNLTGERKIQEYANKEVTVSSETLVVCNETGLQIGELRRGDVVVLTGLVSEDLESRYCEIKYQDETGWICFEGIIPW